MSPSDSPDQTGSILYHSKSSEVPYSTSNWSGTFVVVSYSKPALEAKPVPSNDLILLLFPLRLHQIFRSSTISESTNSHICGFFFAGHLAGDTGSIYWRVYFSAHFSWALFTDPLRCIIRSGEPLFI